MISNIISEIEKKAYSRAEEYCKNEGLSLDLLKTQDLYDMGDAICITQQMPYHGGGLREDISSQPRETLHYNVTKDEITATEYTEKYLKVF